MDDDRDAGLAFAIPDLYAPSRWFTNYEHNAPLFSKLTLDDIDKELPDIVGKSTADDGFFRMPIFGDSGLPTQVTPLEIQHTPESVMREDVDIWLLPEEIPIKAANYRSWENFEDRKSNEPYTCYITEAGPGVFDAALALAGGNLITGNTGYATVESKIYASSLLALGLGRNSVLFAWNDEKLEFVHILPRMRISGYTMECLDGLLSTFMDCGNITKRLRSFVDRAYVRRTSPGQIALADAVSTLLSTIQSCLSESKFRYQSALQLQMLFQPARSILTCFQRIVSKTSNTSNDDSILSIVFEEIQLQEHRTDSLRLILNEILCRVSLPWLEFVGEWLGMQREAGLPLTKDGNGKSFVSVTDKAWFDDQGIESQERDYVLNYDRVPSFIAPGDARVMFEVGRSLRLLKSHHSDHPLARAEVVASAHPPSFEWMFSWQDIVAVEAKALDYEKNLTAAIRQFSKGSLIPVSERADLNIIAAYSAFDIFGKPEEDIQAHVLASINAFDLPLGQNIAPDALASVLIPYLTSSGERSIYDESIFSPPVSLTPLLAFNPLIAAQARIVNGTVMKMFFSSHKLRQHLSLQRSFHLLGNGVFSSRLSHALFDPELESAERYRGVARSGGIMGLRLGGRNTWPPAGSELRLALMGVLTESYVYKEQNSHSGPLESSLPGDLSFAVRDMSEDEIEKCMNPDSIEALDFLRLSYKPPVPLEAVITPTILFKYDQLFKLLLRVLRMLYVVSTLFRDAKDHNLDSDPVSDRFRMEAHNFITSVAGYFFDTGIEATWRIFDRKLDEIEARINDDDDNIALGQNEGLDKLRDYHEHVLDRILFALLLRKRQQPVLQLLEDVFAIVLQFSKYSREKALGMMSDAGESDDVREMYIRFKKNVGVFITVCRGLSERKGYGEKKAMDKVAGHGGLFDGGDLAEENTISHLLTKLEMSNYYSITTSP